MYNTLYVYVHTMYVCKIMRSYSSVIVHMYAPRNFRHFSCKQSRFQHYNNNNNANMITIAAVAYTSPYNLKFSPKQVCNVKLLLLLICLGSS